MDNHDTHLNGMALTFLKESYDTYIHYIYTSPDSSNLNFIIENTFFKMKKIM